jgi:hypothetical protein
MKNLTKILVLALVLVSIGIAGCQKEIGKEKSNNEFSFKYSKNINIKTAQYSIQGIMQSNDSNLLNNTILQIETQNIGQIANNEKIVIDNDQTDSIDTLEPEINMNFMQINILDKNIKALKFRLVEKDQSKCFYSHLSEMTWYSVPFSGITVTTGNYGARAIFKWKRQGGFWHNIFRAHLRKYSSVYGQVPDNYYKLRLKLYYNTYPNVYYQY